MASNISDSTPVNIDSSVLASADIGTPAAVDSISALDDSAPTHIDGSALAHINTIIDIINDSTNQHHRISPNRQVHFHQLTGPVAYLISACVNFKDFIGVFIDVVQGVSSHPHSTAY